MNWPPNNQNQTPDFEEFFRKIEAWFSDPKNPFKIISTILGVLLAVVVLFASFYTVAPSEVGVVKRFGKMVRVTDPGPHLKIPFVETVLKPEVTKVHRLEVGFRTVDPGPPARYRAVEEESLMLTGDENIVSVEFIVQFRIRDPIDFLFNVRYPGQTIKDAAEAAMREVIGASPIDKVLTEGRSAIQQETHELLQTILNRYASGLLITAVQLQDVLPPDEVSAAFKDVASAREDRERAVEQAEGYRNDILPKAKGKAEQLLSAAEGYKQEKINDATGQADRFASVLEEYRKARTVTRKRLYIETMTDVLSRTETVILDSNTGEHVLPYLPLERRVGATQGGRK